MCDDSWLSFYIEEQISKGIPCGEAGVALGKSDKASGQDAELYAQYLALSSPSILSTTHMCWNLHHRLV